MNYSYPDSLVTLAAAVAQACSLHNKNHDNPVTQIVSEDSTFLKLNTNNLQHCGRVGIKFDNISAGKYFALIRTVQQHAAVSKATGKSMINSGRESHVTPKKNEVVRVLGRNEPSVLCQSTFL
jgi:hypothetical protein